MLNIINIEHVHEHILNMENENMFDIYLETCKIQV